LQAQNRWDLSLAFSPVYSSWLARQLKRVATFMRTCGRVTRLKARIDVRLFHLWDSTQEWRNPIRRD
jgi:hypothetical protein